MDSTKLKMNNAKFVKIWTTVLVVIVILAIVATFAMNYFSLSMEIFLGRGNMITRENPAYAGADTDFYPDIETNLDAYTDSVALSIAEEGEVLFKNNGVLPLEKGSSVTPFGYRYINPVYGGGGSGSVNVNSSRIYTAMGVLNEYFKVNSEIEGAMSSAAAQGMSASGYEGPDEQGGFAGAGAQIIEFEPSIYSGHEASAHGTTGIIFIGRIGGEGGDIAGDVPGSAIYGTGYVDGTPHQLALSEYEKEMIRFAKANCDSTVVILNTSNTMEIADLMADDGDLSVDALLWIGGPGGQGYKAMAEILTGEINPSGKAVDTWAVDLMTNPANANFGNYEYTNLYLLQGGFPDPVGAPTEMNYLEYEENVYVGYRYFETVYDTNGTFNVHGQTGVGYDDAVSVPFGQGLSYDTDFTQELTRVDDGGDAITLTVTITNNGSRAGKDVVQVYYNPPYTEMDVELGIEKSTVNLVAFEKTDDIAPGASATVEISFAKEDMASYSYRHDNGDGTLGAYVLEKGPYVISINRNAHEEYAFCECVVDETVWYDNSNPRQSEKNGQALLDDEGKPTDTPAAAEFDDSAAFVAATNRFQDMSDHMAATNQLTRRSGPLENTATSPTAEEMAVIPDGFNYTTDDSGIMTLQPLDMNDSAYLGNVEGSYAYTTNMPATGAEQTMALSELRGASYYDPRWDTLMDQLDFSDPNLYVALTASYDQTAAVTSVGKPATVDFDGPQGIVGSITDATEYTAYPSEPVIAATFNTGLTYRMGDAVGQEASAGGINGWYAPAVNIHRSAFSGRNFEYFSEDPVLSGYLAAAEISGCSDRGLITTLKHFALNDEEMYDNDRSRVSVWANEQAIREIYLKPFEIAVKNARANLTYLDENGEQASKVIRGANAIMNCMNYWGTTWGGSKYELNTQVLRQEWGFQGFIITDMVMNAGSNSVDQALRSGSDTWMAWGNAFTGLIQDTDTASGVSAIRRAVKNMSYSIVNSRAMEGIAPGTIISYSTSPWRIWLTVADITVALFAVIMIVIMIRRTKKAKAHPELYKSPKAKKALQV